MARRPQIKPRKQASQARSRSTVDALVEATARILVKDGFDKASTNRIAEKAGVSIGSLYQYFPSKEALVVAVIERHSAETMEFVRNALADVGSLPFEEAIRRMVLVAIEAHRLNPALHRVLTEQIPRTGRLEQLEVFSHENYAMFRAYLEGCPHQLRPTDPGLAAFICVASIEAVAHNAVLRGDENLGIQASAALASEAAHMIVCYLQSQSLSLPGVGIHGNASGRPALTRPAK